MATSDDADATAAEEPEEGSAPAAETGVSKWMRPSRRPVQPARERTEAEKIHQITNLDAREKKVGYVIAGLVFAILATVSIIGATHPGHNIITPAIKGKCPDSTYSLVKGYCYYVAPTRGFFLTVLAIAIFMTGVIILTIRSGRRSMTLVAVLLMGFLNAVFFKNTLGLAYLGYGAWLLITSYRLQRETGGRQAQIARATAQREQRQAERRRGGAPATTVAGRPAPPASKRYTPKQAPKKKPAPAPKAKDGDSDS